MNGQDTQSSPTSTTDPETSTNAVTASLDGRYVRSQARKKKKLKARRERNGGQGRTDGPRRRKGVRGSTYGRRLRLKRKIKLKNAEDIGFASWDTEQYAGKHGNAD